MKYKSNQKKRILNIAISIIEKDGIDKLTIRRLVNKTNVGTQSVYEHFPNKDALVSTIAHKLTQDFLNEANNCKKFSDKEKLIHSVSLFLKRVNKHHHLIDFIFFNPKIEQILPEDTVNIPNHFIGRINLAINSTNTKTDRQELFLRIWSMIHGLAMMIKAGLLNYHPNLASQRINAII